MADAMRPDAISDDEIAAAVGEELPDRAATSTLTTGCDPSEFGVLANAVIPPEPGGEPPPDTPTFADD